MEGTPRPDWLPANRTDSDVRPSREAPDQVKAPRNESPGRPPLAEDLPHPNTKRWVVRRKAAVVAAVRCGGLTVEEACRIYQLSKEELLSWERAFELHGLAGLRATRIQQYRAPRRAQIPLRAAEPAD